MNKVIDYIFSIDRFEQKCVVLKGMLHSLRLKDHVRTIGIYQSLSNNTIYEHKCLENVKRLCKQAVKCDEKILLRFLWFLLLKDSPTTVLYLPKVNQHQSRNHVIKNHCVYLLTF